MRDALAAALAAAPLRCAHPPAPAATVTRVCCRSRPVARPVPVCAVLLLLLLLLLLCVVLLLLLLFCRCRKIII